MMHSTYFVQECPTCGRTLRIRVEYLGRQLTCQHCRGKLQAQDPDSREGAPPLSGMALLQRANELLSRSRIA
jgi:DNA-directed RNA polymerase subunit RPC12/RpoP